MKNNHKDMILKKIWFKPEELEELYKDETKILDIFKEIIKRGDFQNVVAK